MARRARRLGGWLPVVVAAAVVAVVVAVVWFLVAAGVPTAGRADDVAVYETSPGVVMSDALAGSLRREAGCTYLDATDGRRWLPFFPDVGTAWDDGRLAVGTERFEVGTELDLVGRIVKTPEADHVTHIPSGCRTTGLYFLVRTD